MDEIALKKVNKVFSENGVLFAFLFGSRVTGKTLPTSDYDFAIFLNTKDQKEQFRIRKKLTASLPTIVGNRIDIVILNSADLELAFRAISKGKLIFDKDKEIREDFLEYIFKYYPDYHIFQEKFFEEYRQEIIS